MTTTTIIAPKSSDTTTDCGSGTILVAVNGRKSGWRALDWAVAESALHQRPLRIVHVANWPLVTLDPVYPMGLMSLDLQGSYAVDRAAHTLDRAKLILDEAVARARLVAPTITLTAHLEAGNTREVILRSGRGDALIVVGAGRTRRRGLPTLASRITRRARGPVVVVKLLDEGSTSSPTERQTVLAPHRPTG
jgi:nucleotide-binding universal stress UspA family protein